MSNKSSKPQHLFSVSCRSVGPGGTDVDFIGGPSGIKAIWTNENCPYCPVSGRVVDEDGTPTYEALDGHNVSKLTWERLAAAVALAKEKGWLK